MVDELVFNGLNARTGGYLLEPLPAPIFAKLASGAALDADELRELNMRRVLDRSTSFSVDNTDLLKNIEDVGWGVLLPHARDDEARRWEARILDALKPLLDLRKAQASAVTEARFHVFTGPQRGWRDVDTKRSWLERQGAGFGPPVPDKVPYYLLIVAPPTRIDFRPQHLLDIQHAVGRLHFDTVDEYAYYAQSVVAAERGKGLALPRTMGFFGARSPDDASTLLSSEHLVEPLADWAGTTWKDWTVERAIRDGATKEALTDWLGAGKTPSLLFTASHGMAFPRGDVLQRPHQGALLCSDWPGPVAWGKEIPQDFYLAADDLGSDARLHGLIAFNFACFGAGTPHHDSFVRQAFKDRPSELADGPFISALPQKMLAHPGGGALAVIGHVDRAWGYSFLGGRDATRQLQVFKDTFNHLVQGRPVGFAIDVFNSRYAEIAAELTDLYEDAEYTTDDPDPIELAELWTTQNDARGYVILGDPAVKLMVDRDGGGRPRMPLALTSTSPETEETIVPTGNGDDEDDTTPPMPAGHTDFGWFSKDKDEDAEGEAPGLLKRFTQEVGEKLTHAIRDLTSLEIRTFVADGRDIVDVSKLPPGELDKHATLKAYTRMAMDGDLDLLVPQQAGGSVDKALWDAHKEMVKAAQAHRMELIKAALELIKPTKKK